MVRDGKKRIAAFRCPKSISWWKMPRAALRLAGIETEGKRSDEILKMARQERNKPISRSSIRKL